MQNARPTNRVFSLEQIKAALVGYDSVQSIAEGFAAYTRGEVVVPPVGEMLFDDPRGDAHIKYGFIKGDSVYVIKIAAGFYDNPRLGLPVSSGLILVFSQKSGHLEAILLDDGYLTNVRTAAAGAVAARYLAPRRVDTIGVIGTGTQGRMQVEYLRSVVPSRDVIAFNADPAGLDAYVLDMSAKGYSVQRATSVDEVAAKAQLIICSTPATVPYLKAQHLRPGMHITAVGSDTPEKTEVTPDGVARADLVITDSLSQCRERGEIHHAIRAGLLAETDVVEIGAIAIGRAQGRTRDTQITLADFTGLAVQDVQIAKAVLTALGNAPQPRG